MLPFESVEEGDEIAPFERPLTKDEVREYARVNGIDFARFTDDEGARKEGLPGMIAPGNMSMGLLATYVESWAGAGTLVRLGTTFRGLVLPGHPVTLFGVVTQKHDDAQTAEVDLWMESHEGERVVIGTATVQLG